MALEEDISKFFSWMELQKENSDLAINLQFVIFAQYYSIIYRVLMLKVDSWITDKVPEITLEMV